ncbi:MAG TPA: tetratricopeptide repeat protein [Verrucomicrobiae bacterium]|nr:tetratricopeptide repeat protein [Verrucomicrobiae bacterium]
MKRIAFGIGLFLLFAQLASAADSVSFNKDIAPIIFDHCSTCHRPGEAGPFPLLTFENVKKRARQIVEVTGRGYMPPWLPEGPKGEFIGDRRLTSGEIDLLKRWFDQGTSEGDAKDLPPLPKWPADWLLGEPDLIVRMPKSYTLPAEGRDVYRNFVLPVTIDKPCYVRAVEFRPDNPRIVHHAFIKVDYSGQGSILDGSDGQTGFEGMNLPDGIRMPSGYFLSYQPGKTPSSEPPGYGWTLRPGQNLVLQAHLRPSGKQETLQAQVGLYFTQAPPTNATLILSLGSLNIDIPPGSNQYTVEDSFTLPVDVDLLSVLPHTHYLGKRLEGFAILPDGTKRQLLSIPNWDFNWQGDYRYSRSVHLAAGSQLRMSFLYDNSDDNPRNPNHPPKEILYGPQSKDEMAELWFQVRLGNTNDEAVLAKAYNNKNRGMFANYVDFQLQRDPHNARARSELGFLEWTDGQLDKAIDSFREACTDDPAFDQPHYYLGVLYRTKNRLVAARAELEAAVRLNPKNAKAYGNLSYVFIGLGSLDRAERSIRQALKLDPKDPLSGEALEEIRRLRKSQNP